MSHAGHSHSRKGSKSQSRFPRTGWTRLTTPLLLEQGAIKWTETSSHTMTNMQSVWNHHNTVVETPLVVKVRMQPPQGSLPIGESEVLQRSDNYTRNGSAMSASRHEAFMLLAYGLLFPG
ncbi:hypothetical protein BDW68DRAFT_166963 [Aspergillus falconensis]